MSGGRLVVVDRAGRDMKHYELASGLATLGSAPACDIRVILPSVQPHHATVVVHAAQTVVRNVGGGETLVNGRAVSVAALRHGDRIELGGRALRWEYVPPRKPAGTHSPATLPPRPAPPVARARARRASAASAAAPDRALQLALELRHRASMPAGAGGKQVAVVQPQRRDPAGHPGECTASRAASHESPGATHTTQATLWIESRKPRRATLTPRRATLTTRRATLTTRRATLTTRRATRHASLPRVPPLRRTALKRARPTAELNLIKIEAPLKIDHTKRAAIMLMTGHTPRARISVGRADGSPSVAARRSTPASRTPRGRRSAGRGGATLPDRSLELDSPAGGSDAGDAGSRSVTILEIADSTRASSSRGSTLSRASLRRSALPPSPRKSALKDRSGRGARKTESIKFDLSNLSRASRASGGAGSDEELTLRYSDSSSPSPSPRRALRSASPRALETYSVVDLVSFDSRSAYDSAASLDSSAFGTPATSGAAGSSTPYARAPPAAPRASRSRSRIDPPPASPPGPAGPPASPRSSRRARASAPPDHAPTPTPESRSPEAAGTPVLSIRSLLGSTRSSSRGASSASSSSPDASVGGSPRRAAGALPRDGGGAATPTDEVRIAPEEVKRKHSTARKPRSRRSIIDDLDRSDAVKQLFGSPVKRKLSRSMTEFPGRRLEDDDAAPRARRSTRGMGGPAAARPSASAPASPERLGSPAGAPPARSPPARSPGAGPARPARARRAGTPRNDLTDVRGVRELFRRTSPENDLRDVSGVARVLRNAAPRNELDDLRGVRNMFRRRATAADPDVSGVEELFRESAGAGDAAFDSLLERRPARAVYSKTFSAASTRQTPRGRARKSLPGAIDVTAENVEEWLQRELRKRMPAGARAPAGAPRQSPRAHDGRAGPARRHTAEWSLPLKKRALVEGARLPLKKRSLHSTPRRGARPRARLAAHLRRVSPIAPPAHRSARTFTDEKSIVAPSEACSPRKQEISQKIDVSAASPAASPTGPCPPKRETRSRKITESSRANASKRRSSMSTGGGLVVPKKPAASRPARVRAPRSNETAEVTPRKTRTARTQKVEKLDTPRRTKIRASKATVVVAKPSPRLKPRPKSEVADLSRPEEEKPKRTRKAAAVKAEVKSPKLSPRNNRRARAAVAEPEPQPKSGAVEVEKSAPTRRGRRTAAVEAEPPAPLKRSRKAKAVESDDQKTTETRGRKPAAVAKPEAKENLPKTRAGKVASSVTLPPETVRGRGRRAAPVVEEKQTKTRGNKLEVKSHSEEIQPKARGRRAEISKADTIVPETKGRKRKAAAVEEIPAKVAKAQPKRGKKADASVSEVTKTTGRGRRAATEDNKAETDITRAENATRGRRAKKVEETSEPVKKATPVRLARGRKLPAAPASPAAQRKRKAAVEPSPAEVASKKAATKATKAASEPAPTPRKTRGRPAKGKLQPEVPTKAAGRSRRQ